MISSDLQKPFRLPRHFEKRGPVTVGDDLVLRAMDHKDRASYIREGPVRAVSAAQQEADRK